MTTINLRMYITRATAHEWIVLPGTVTDDVLHAAAVAVGLSWHPACAAHIGGDHDVRSRRWAINLTSALVRVYGRRHARKAVARAIKTERRRRRRRLDMARYCEFRVVGGLRHPGEPYRSVARYELPAAHPWAIKPGET